MRRTVKSRDIFSPEDESGKKAKGRARGRRKKRLYRGSDLKNLLEDEKTDPMGKASSNEKGGELRRDLYSNCGMGGGLGAIDSQPFKRHMRSAVPDQVELLSILIMLIQ